MRTSLRHLALPASLPVAVTGPVVPREVLGSLREADELLRAARLEAETLVARARAEAAGVATAAADAAAERVWSEATALLETLRGRLAQLESQAAETLTRLGASALRRLRVELPEPWPTRSSAHLLLDEWRRQGAPRPVQLRVPIQQADRLPAGLLEGTGLDLVEGPELAPGACVLVCEGGELHASFAGSLDALIRAWLDRRASDAASSAGSDLSRPATP